MRAILGCGLAAVLAAVAASGADARDEKIDGTKLVGKWQLADTPKGVSVLVEFTKDSKVKIAIDIAGRKENSEGTYKLDGNKLSLSIRKNDKDEPDTSTVTKLTGDDLEMTDGKGRKEKMTRVKDKK